MRRTALALSLLLAAAPNAGATEVSPESKPEMRAVEVAAPAIRKTIAVAPARSETRSNKAARSATMQMDREAWTIVLICAAIAVAALVFL